MMDFSLVDEVQALQANTYDIRNEVRANDASINQAIDTISGSSEGVLESFDAFRSFLKQGNQLNATQLSKILDALLSAFTSEIDVTARDGLDLNDLSAYRAHKQVLELYAFLLWWFVRVAERHVNIGGDGDGDGDEAAGTATTTTAAAGGSKRKGGGAAGRGKSAAKGKGKDAFAWEDNIRHVLAVFAKALRIKTERIWQTTQERDSFVGCFTKAANQIAESEAHMKSNDIKLGIFKVMCIAAKSHGQAFGTQVMVMQNLMAYEHLPEAMAELVAVLVKEFDYAHLGEELLREIAGKTFTGGTDTKAQKPFPRFLIKLSELCPRLVLKQMVVLQKHLDSDSYLMRNAIIEVIGNLIREVANAEEDGEAGQQKRELDNFFGLLFDRFLDLNGFVRSKVVQTFAKILEIPTNRFAETRLRLTALAVRSLEDKTSTVRKNCIALLTKLILTHPYGALHGGELELSRFKEGYDRTVAELDPMEAPSQAVLDAMAEDKENESEEENDNDDNDDNDESAKSKRVKVKKEVKDFSDSDEESSDEDEPREERAAKAAAAKASKKARPSGPRRSSMAIQSAFSQLDQDKLTKLRLTKRYYSDAITFITHLEQAVPQVEKLLASKVKSEVLESMDFFKVAYEYKIESAESGVRRMLHLVWSKDNSTVEDGQELKGVRSRLIECYRSLYFDPLRDLSPVENVNRITKNMIQLTFGATLAELTSLEQLMNILMTENAVHEDIIAKLWQAYSTPKDIPRIQRRGAIIILGMLATAKPEIVSEHIDSLLRIGLGVLGKSDYVLAKYTCIALRRIGGSQKKVKGSLNSNTTRLPMDNPVFERLKEAVQNVSEDPEWFGMAEQALNTIYALGEQPDALCSDIIRDLTIRVFSGSQKDREGTVATPEPATQGGIQAVESAQTPAHTGDGEGTTARGDSTQGEGQLPTETPRSTTSPEAHEGSEMGNAFQLAQLLFAAGHVAVKHLVHLELLEIEFKRRKAELEKKEQSKASQSEELDQVVGSVEDDIADVVLHAKEKELLYGPDSLLAVFGPMSVAVCSQPKLYKNETLRIAAVSAMSKFMCVSSQFCEEHLMLLFKILETTSNPVIRSNIVIALGDIAVAFSTLMDQNSDRLYAGLTDKDLTVKKNTLMVLTHLILNGMIKVKGQLGEMAKCLQDEEARISDLAKLFFEELSTKENAIYNNLPDIISHLSIGKHAVDEEDYQSIMRYIFRYIEKEKQAESIIEKLCVRFRAVTEERQWRDIAFCLSLLPFRSERSVKKLVEGLPYYQDKLREETVYRLFLEILNKARSTKAVKNEDDLLEFEKALGEHKQLGQENAAIERKAQRKTKRKAGAAANATARAATRTRGRRRSTTPPSSPER